MALNFPLKVVYSLVHTCYVSQGVPDILHFRAHLLRGSRCPFRYILHFRRNLNERTKHMNFTCLLFDMAQIK